VRDAAGNVMAVYEMSDLEDRPKKIDSHFYGSSRIGVVTSDSIPPGSVDIQSAFGSGILYTFTRSEKLYELSNHLGNVLATVSDKKLQHRSNNATVDYYLANVVSAQDYYSFGMLMPGRKFSSGSYRYGFNGKENDNEVKGEGNTVDYGMRVYDSRLGRASSVDPYAYKYPHLSTYQFFSNTW
jgi:hypothetical protein